MNNTMRPNQKSGIDMKRKEKVMTNISIIEFCRTAATIPIGMAIMIERRVAQNIKRNVKG